MNRIAVILLGIIALPFAPGIGLSQFVPPEHITFIGAESTAGQTKQSVFAVQVARTNQSGGYTWIPLGSGFLINKSNMTFGVTCEHVITGADKLFAEGGYMKVIFVGLDTKSNGYVRLPSEVIHKDRSTDVAVLTLKAPFRDGKQALEFAVGSIGEHLVADEHSVVQGRGVLILGYPLGLGIEANQNRPLVRFGMVAQDSNESSFLIDGTASHGNSGSPVFLLVGPRTQFAGMVIAFKNESITLFDGSGQTAARLPYNSGLAVAVKASVILKAIDEAERKLLLTK